MHVAIGTREPDDAREGAQKALRQIVLLAADAQAALRECDECVVETGRARGRRLPEGSHDRDRLVLHAAAGQPRAHRTPGRGLATSANRGLGISARAVSRHRRLHRWRLAKHRGERLVEATVHRFPAGPVGEQAFEFEAVRSNLQHGLPLSREERNRAIARLWSRWGRSEGRPDGHTLDEIGQLFNLTKQRVHQILLAQQSPDAGASAAAQYGGREPASKLDMVRPVPRHPRDVVSSTGTGRAGMPGRFSTLGRFSAASRRMRNLLRDDRFMAALWKQHRIEALTQLRELHGLIDGALAVTR